MPIEKILCHVGPWSDAQYHFIASQIAPQASISILSGHPKCDQSGLFALYHQLISEGQPSHVVEATPLELDIVLRCRLLRAIDLDKALFHLRAMWHAMGAVLDRIKPDLILTETIDSYVMDVLYFQARQRNIAFIGLVPTFISGYFRVSARGEYVPSRTVSASETQIVLDKLLQRNYKPDFIKNSDSRLWVYATGRWLRNLIKIPHFLVKRLDAMERFNYHNWATLIVAKQWAHVFPVLNIGQPQWRARLLQATKPIVYIPLQMIPEATVDYWCEDLQAVDYDAYLLRMVEHLKNDFTLLIKEHPNVLGYRNPKLYHQLGQIDSVIFAPTHIASHELVDASNTVLVWTGSVGFEAAIRGKPVLTTCAPYYVHGDSFKRISHKTPVIEIKQYLQSFDNKAAVERNHDLVSHVLSGALPGRYIIDGSWSSDKPEHVEYAKNIALQLKGYLNFAGIEQA